MTSIANAIMFYGFMKYAKSGEYPLGITIMLAAVADIAIAAIISAGL